jgi:hypothetical protein
MSARRVRLGPRPSYKRIFVVVSHDGMLCDLADTYAVALEMRTECHHRHEEPHRVVPYERAAIRKGRR